MCRYLVVANFLDFKAFSRFIALQMFISVGLAVYSRRRIESLTLRNIGRFLRVAETLYLGLLHCFE